MSARAASAGSDSELVEAGDARRLVFAEITVDAGAENRERVPGAQARAQRDSAQVIRATGLEAAAQQRQPLGQRPDGEEPGAATVVAHLDGEALREVETGHRDAALAAGVAAGRREPPLAGLEPRGSQRHGTSERAARLLGSIVISFFEAEKARIANEKRWTPRPTTGRSPLSAR